MMPSNKKWLLIALVVILVLILIIGGLPKYRNWVKNDDQTHKNSVPRVAILQVKPNTKPVELILPSSAQGWHVTPIWSRVNGYLLRYLVDIGDTVKRGDLLAEIDTPETDQQLLEAKADLQNAIAERDIAKVTSDRWQKLWNKNQQAVSKQEVDQYNANLQSAEAVVLMNEKNVARLIYQQQFKNIYAPFDGIITQRSVDVGTLIYGTINGFSQELFQIGQIDTLRFFVEVPQTYYTQIKDGLEAEVTVQQLPDKIFKGTVARFAKSLDPAARTMLSQVNVANPDGLLYPGIFGKVKFLLTPNTLNFIIPTTALIIRSGYPHVATVDENQIVHLKQVQIGRDYGSHLQIISGLQTDDHIIVLPSDQIKDGLKVATTPSPPLK